MYTIDPEDIAAVEDVRAHLLSPAQVKKLLLKAIFGVGAGFLLTLAPIAIDEPPSDELLWIKVDPPVVRRILQVGCWVLGTGAIATALTASWRLKQCWPYIQLARMAHQRQYANSMGTVLAGYKRADELAWTPWVHEQQHQQVISVERQALPPEPTSALPAAGEDPLGLVAALLRLGVNAKWVGSVQGASFRRCRVKLNQSPKPQKIAAVKALAEDLAAELGLLYTPFISRDGGNVAIDIPRPDRQTLLFSQFISFNPQPNDPIQIAVGVNLDGELIYAELSDTNTCHILVGGTTGSGKTEFLKAAIASLIWHYSPDKVQVIIVDPKRTKYNDFAGLPWLYCPIVKDVEGAINLMTEMVMEMEKRYQLFEDSGCENIDGYLNKAGKTLPRIIVIYDEFADFMGDKEDKAAIELSAKRLGQKAREAGIHLILATQRPDKDVVTPILRSNLPGRIALRVKSEGDSNIILGEGENAHHLLGKGDLLYQTSGGTVRLQSLFLDDISCMKNPDVQGGETSDRTSPNTSRPTSTSTSTSTSTPNPEVPPFVPEVPTTKDFPTSTSPNTDARAPGSEVLEEAARALEVEGKSLTWVVENILKCKGRKFGEGKQLINEYLKVRSSRVVPQASDKVSKLDRLKELLATGCEAAGAATAGAVRTQLIRQLWGEIRVDAHLDAEKMLDAMLVEISSEVSRESILRVLPAKDWESRQWISQLPGIYLIYSSDCSRLFYVGRTEGKTSVNLRINSTKYAHHKLPRIQQALSAGIEIAVGWITCYDEQQRIAWEDKLIEVWQPEWNNSK